MSYATCLKSSSIVSKLAFCFLTYGDIHQGGLWKDFFEGHSDQYNIYLHNKFPLTDNFFGQNVIDNIIDTKYGFITQLKASINLFEAAWNNPDNKYFILVSGSCLPLQNFQTIYAKIFDLGGTLFKPMVQLPGRLKYLKDKTVFNRDNFKTQSTWMVMKREDFPKILENDMTDSVFGNRVFGVDHHYFINLFGLFDMEYREYPVAWDNWNEPDIRHNPHHYGPKTYETLDQETIDQAWEEGSFFIRKIAENCQISQSLVDTIRPEPT